jgi:hypothetical protein
MGRHSAPDEDDEVESDVQSETLTEARAGTGAAVGGEPAADPPAAESAGAADLRLLRENPSLRARCAAAVAVPFAVYTVVMIVVGQVSQYLLWVWLPTVLAGILVGVFLDRAHKQRSSG